MINMLDIEQIEIKKDKVKLCPKCNRIYTNKNKFCNFCVGQKLLKVKFI